MVIDMRILAVADEESAVIREYWKENGYNDVDLIVSCGDLSGEYLEDIAKNLGCPLLYVKGNHDAMLGKPRGAECIDCSIMEINGIRICGFSSIDRWGRVLSEHRMRRKTERMRRRIVKTGGIDVLVTHHPILGVGDGDDKFHRGYEAFRELVDAVKPRFVLYGHVHLSYKAGAKRVIEYGETTVINAYEKTFIEI
ncbi:MAG: metallophosphoesterase family protein [Clostridia bacterium]|nr:metallophosphoesterase family protein [Clostridia bacterium]